MVEIDQVNEEQQSKRSQANGPNASLLSALRNVHAKHGTIENSDLILKEKEEEERRQQKENAKKLLDEITQSLKQQQQQQQQQQRATAPSKSSRAMHNPNYNDSLRAALMTVHAKNGTISSPVAVETVANKKEDDIQSRQNTKGHTEESFTRTLVQDKGQKKKQSNDILLEKLRKVQSTTTTVAAAAEAACHEESFIQQDRKRVQELLGQLQATQQSLQNHDDNLLYELLNAQGSDQVEVGCTASRGMEKKGK